MRRAATRVAAVTMYASRPYAGVDDLRRMQDAVSAAFSHTSVRAGDLAWAVREHSHIELSVWVRLWHDLSGRLVGWTWFSPSGWVEVFVVPGETDASLLDDMMDAVDELTSRVLAAGDPMDMLRVTVDEGDALVRDRLEAHGFHLDGWTLDVGRRALDEVAAPTTPADYRLGFVDETLVTGRVEAQRAAFAPSTMTLSKYQRVRRTMPYREDLDRVVLDGSGEVVAFCTAWLDARTASGLLEPVGTHPDHRQRGLATAVVLDALTALRDAGASTAQVLCETGSPGCATYRRAGFETAGRIALYRKPLVVVDGVAVPALERTS